MIRSGLDIISSGLPAKLNGKRVAVLCHAPSINSEYRHIIDILARCKELDLVSVFGPQHGLFGETQDNMIEWEGYRHADHDIPVYSLYGKNRKPSEGMLGNTDAMLVDLQDIGARPYTYIWTLKHCMEACGELGIPLWVLDRPNPVSTLGRKGPVLKKEYYTFVGGAGIPMCHNMTIAEIAIWLRDIESVNCELSIVWMDKWKRGMSFRQTGLPWVPPSPNMPSVTTALVYPGTVLTEALNLSEARGTTTPFELFGAPDLNTKDLLKNLEERKLASCVFRLHDYIPTFHKYKDQYCKGIFIHLTDPFNYDPVYTAINIYDALMQTNPAYLTFNKPPYEYEYRLMPFDILFGDSISRKLLQKREDISKEKERWCDEINAFEKVFKEISYY